MNPNPLRQLHPFRQSIWLDFIQKGMLYSGELQSLITDDDILGMTSNPSIFEKAITGSHDYDDAIRNASREGKTAKEIYERLTISDVQKAADIFLPTFDKTKCRDGFVSLEVSPHLARDTEGTIAEAHALWKKVARPNILIKVPATREGVPAIKRLISDGINVNVTLLFGLERYDEVIEAFLSGLESRVEQKKSIKGIASVASFFLSRIDLACDLLLPKDSELKGEIAIASAKVAYQKYTTIFESKRFKVLQSKGAVSQRLLWASTSTKNPTDSDIKYVEALIGPDTINTLPMETLNAYRNHGSPANRLETGPKEAVAMLANLSEVKINLKTVTDQLERDGVQKFSSAFDKLITSLEISRNQALSDKVEKAEKSEFIRLENCEQLVQTRLAKLHAENYYQRIWKKDAALWKADPSAQAMIKNSLGWLHIADKMEDSWIDTIHEFVRDIRRSGFEQVVHMGMGGSSLAALVFARTFSPKDGLPLIVLDTTDPETIKNLDHSIPIEKTLFIVASKSGTTAEPLAFRDYFYERVKEIKGDQAGENFIAITDPGTPLVKESEALNFRRIFLNAPDIGGRYSALSYFGMIPAALMGINIDEVMNRALQSVKNSVSCDSNRHSPGLIIGAALGEMVLQNRNKITLITDKSIETLGVWLEQLMAESTGKDGTGIIPIANEPIGEIENYGNDRFFIYIKNKSVAQSFDTEFLGETISALKKSGHPILTIELTDLFDLGREFFQWEFATAAAGSILSINAFDQPNVQESKDNTNRLLSTNQEEPNDKDNEGSDQDLEKFFKSSRPGDYFSLMAFLPESKSTTETLQTIRSQILNKLKIATTLGYGPRFLHSTGQLHKGGPNTGLFLQITADEQFDISIPGRPYTFGKFIGAEAQGDFEALQKHGRRVLRIHLGHDIEDGLQKLFLRIQSLLETI